MPLFLDPSSGWNSRLFWNADDGSGGGDSPDEPEGNPVPPDDGIGGDIHLGKLLDLPIEQELKDAYLTYAMSVIVSRALPDVRDGLKPSQRRILVAMNDLNLGPQSGRMKCAKISGQTSGDYHPHGEAVIYPTLVRMAQEWNMRHMLVDKQGNFGSIAGLPAAAMRYTEARMSSIAAMLLEDLNLDTVDFVPTYDERNTEPTVLPGRFPNLLVNGANGIAVGMATSLPPHNLGEICDALVRVIDQPDVSIDELMEIVPGPDFPTGGIVMGRSNLRRAYHTGRATITLRARAHIEEFGKGRHQIVVTEVPYQAGRDRIEERIGELINDDRIKGIRAARNESDLKDPVRLVYELDKSADPEVVLNQLYQFSPLQDSVSIILLALVDGKPRTMNFKVLLEEFIRHRVTVIRRRTQFLLKKARTRKHTVEGLLLALANIDEVIMTIRQSKTQAEAKARLMGIETPAAMMQRALGDSGFAVFQSERGVSATYTLSAVQAEAILRMTLGSLVNLEQEKLGGEHAELLAEIEEFLRILGDEQFIMDLIRQDCIELKRKYGDDRRTEISGEELGSVNLEDLINEETMVVTISTQGYIKRTVATAYRAQRRGGKGILGAKSEEEDPIAHLFAASTHDYLLFFTNFGKVYWQKVYDLPQLDRDRKGRAIQNLLNLGEGEKIASCLPVRDFKLAEHYLMMATRKGLVKKTALSAYGRPLKGGLIAIKLKDEDELIDVVVAKKGDEVVISSGKGMAIRFSQADARAMGRNTSGVKGINLGKTDELAGMVIADPEATLLTVCEKGYGKRTLFGPNEGREDDTASEAPEGEEGELVSESDSAAEAEPTFDPAILDADSANSDSSASDDGDEGSSSQRYRTQRRGGKGVRDIKTTDRNGPVVDVVSVTDGDEILIITKGGKLQRLAVKEISVIGRNTQGVRIMNMDEGDTIAAVVRVPQDPAAALAEKTDTTPTA